MGSTRRESPRQIPGFFLVKARNGRCKFDAKISILQGFISLRFAPDVEGRAKSSDQRASEGLAIFHPLIQGGLVLGVLFDGCFGLMPYFRSSGKKAQNYGPTSSNLASMRAPPQTEAGAIDSLLCILLEFQKQKARPRTPPENTFKVAKERTQKEDNQGLSESERTTEHLGRKPSCKDQATQHFGI